MHSSRGKTLAQCIKERTDYSRNPNKTNGGELISAYECAPETVDTEFLLAKEQYKILTGRTQEHDVIAYQIRQSFKPGEITPEEANRIGYEFAMRFTKGKHAFIVCTHIDRKHIHNHVIWNSTNLDCDRKFRNFWGSTEAVRKLSDQICMEHKLSVVENPQRRGASYNRWMGSTNAAISHREELRILIDEALAKKPHSFDALLEQLETSGYEISRGKNITFVKDGQKNIRLSSLGEGYSKAELRAVILGARKHTPRKRSSSGNYHPRLITEIEERISGGSTQWDSVRILKQMAQSVLYVQEHDFESIDDLRKQSENASARTRELSDTIKATEKRMGEIAVLQTHIANYSKTRDVYVGYRKAGYSKIYFAEHESDILLHKAAKKAFDDLGVTKIPTVKSLRQEYADLLSQKKAAYAEYTEAKKEMRELSIHCQNIEYILNLEKPQEEKRQGKEAERGET